MLSEVKMKMESTMNLETIVNSTASDTNLTRTYTLSKDYKVLIAMFGSSVGATSGCGMGTLSASTKGNKILDKADAVGDERLHKIIILNAKKGDTITFNGVKWFSCYSIHGLN